MLPRAALVAALGAAVAAGALLVAGADGQDGRAREPRASARPNGVSTGEIQGLRAALVDRERRLPDGRISWSTRWRLCWKPVAGARSYAIAVATSEGVDPRSRSTPRTCFGLAVANGVGRRPGERRGRDAQLSVMQAMLAVSVAAKLVNGRVGPWSQEVSVGARYP